MFEESPVNGGRRIRLPQKTREILVTISGQYLFGWYVHDNNFIGLAPYSYPITADDWEKVAVTKVFGDGRYIRPPEDLPDHLLCHFQSADPPTIKDEILALTDMGEDDLVDIIDDGTPRSVDEEEIQEILDIELRPSVYFLTQPTVSSSFRPRACLLTQPQVRQLLPFPPEALSNSHEQLVELLLHHIDQHSC